MSTRHNKAGEMSEWGKAELEARAPSRLMNTFFGKPELEARSPSRLMSAFRGKAELEGTDMRHELEARSVRSKRSVRSTKTSRERNENGNTFSGEGQSTFIKPLRNAGGGRVWDEFGLHQPDT